MFVSCSNSSGSGSGDSSDQESVPLIVFASDSDGDFEIYSLDPNNLSAAAIQLTDNSAVEKHPSLTKDGSKIVFVSDRNSGNFEIFTMNSDGSNVSSALVTLGGPLTGTLHGTMTAAELFMMMAAISMLWMQTEQIRLILLILPVPDPE